MGKEQLCALTELAACDGKIDSSERDLIISIGESSGLEKGEILEILEAQTDYYHLDELSEDERFDLLYNAILLMKIDGKVKNEEVRFCEYIANKLGYELRAIMEIYPEVHPNVKIAGVKEKLRRKVSEMHSN